jgi:hypothetical protein
MVWSVGGKLSPMDTVIYTGPRGNIDVRYTVPASPPGRYRLTAKINTVPYATTSYRVVSRATLNASVQQTSVGQELVIHGAGFVPKFRLALVAYHAVGTSKPIVLRLIRAASTGGFAYRGTIKRLPPGQYILRAWSVSQLAAQMAETSFEVNQ